jgi:hypothetical protein
MGTSTQAGGVAVLAFLLLAAGACRGEANKVEAAPTGNPPC